MLIGAKIKMKTFVHDDSGVALASTLVVFLVSVLMIMSTYVLGNTVRERMELQNATDNAAYAGALAQADVLSRIAVLNRALAWTYVQSNRMQTDYIMNRWLTDVRTKFLNDCTSMVNKNIQYSRKGCIRHNISRGFSSYLRNDPVLHSAYRSKNTAVNQCYVVGYNGVHGELRLTGSAGGNNRARTDRLNTVMTTYGISSYTELAPMIQAANNNIYLMNGAIASLKDNMFVYVNSAVSASLSRNLKNALTFSIVGDPGSGRDYTKNTSSTHTSHTGNASSCFERIASEEQFFGTRSGYGNHYFSSDSTFNRDSWNSLPWWTQTSSSAGFYRQYSGNHSMSWNAGYGSWVCDDSCKGSVITSSSSSSLLSVVTANYSVGGTLYSHRRGYPAAPWRMTQNFFGRPGTIVVAAKRQLLNPFASGILGSKNNADIGFYGAFGLNTPTDVWTVSAARAGIRIPGSSVGAYETTFVGNGSTWNMFADDWDAVMLPLGKAWKSGVNRTWNNMSGNNPTDNVYDILSYIRKEFSVNSAMPLTREVNYDIIH